MHPAGSGSPTGRKTASLLEVLAAVFTVHRGTNSGRPHLQLLLWRRAKEPDTGRWALPGGVMWDNEDVDASARRQLAEKVDLQQVSHLEQTGVFSDPGRMPDVRMVATGFLGLVPMDADPTLPEDTAWHPVDDLPDMAFDHAIIADRALQRLQAKLSYTNIGFALAPESFALAELGRIYAAALGHDVDVTNLQRILTRRRMLEPTGSTAPPGPTGGRPAAMYRFSVGEYRVTDPFAAFRPPVG
ncbi:MAG TPA: NUDIX domain-containing protein [Nakamurella sp.]|jgi:8-oxo-dGTP diphosphatase